MTMLPLYGPMFIPSLFVTPLVLLVAYVVRKHSAAYPRFWWAAVVICLLLTLYFTIVVLVIPFYSQRDHRPDNPGGFGKGSTLPELLTVLLFTFCLVVPSFPTLLGLAFLPPRDLQIGWRYAPTVLIAMYVVVVSIVIYIKHVRYVADYQQTRQTQLLRKERQWRLQPPPKRPPPPPQPLPQQQQKKQEQEQGERKQPIA